MVEVCETNGVYTSRPREMIEFTYTIEKKNSLITN